MDNPDHDMSLSSNPSPLKRRFAQGFLRALARIRNRDRSRPKLPGSSPIEMARRHRRVKAAADAAMASAVGPRRVWSRAVLRKIRSQKLRRFGPSWRSIGTSTTRRESALKMIKKAKSRGKVTGLAGHEKKLRRVVPGGEDMDIYSLLEETFHYIRCLKTQVNVMKRIAEVYST